MQDLINKIEELKTLLKALAMTPKSKPQGLVPALKAPSLRPISMPSTTGGAPTKIPGVEPPSNKDPKKVAQQLKNPKPKKPNMSMVIKFDDNGQWSLDN